MKSYTYIQRRTRTANLILGTKYSAKEIFERQKAAEAKGYTTQAYEIISKFTPARSDTIAGRSLSASAQGAALSVYFAPFEQLAQESPYVDALIHAGGDKYYVGSTIYIKEDDTVREVTPHGEGPVAELPDAAQPLTPAISRHLVEAYAKALREKNRRTPGYGYDVELIESFFA